MKKLIVLSAWIWATGTAGWLFVALATREPAAFAAAFIMGIGTLALIAVAEVL
jgi:hypothetical protein